MDTQKIYYLEFGTFKRNTAGFKAPDDIYQICKHQGFTQVLMPDFPLNKHQIYTKIWLATTGIQSWKSIDKKVPDGSIVIFQHPQYGKRIVKNYVEKYEKSKNLKFIALIHDLESIRGGMRGIVSENKKTNNIGDNDMLMKFHAVICHNEHMRQYMISQGFESKRLINLNIFDYLSDVERVQPPKGERPSIAIAGNLAKVKAGYIPKIFYDGHNKGLDVHLYGTRYEDDGSKPNLIYHGAFPPEELAAHLQGDFGLIWDGQEAFTCAGNTGNYLRYNNPHKASMYLSAGMPVVVWSEAAIADFVRDNRVGITVDSLYELEERISHISSDEYEILCRNAREISQKIRDGYYTKNAIDKAISIVTER